MSEQSHDSLLGVQIDEYRLEMLLGRGGMARVYRGLDVRLNRYVAIKVIDTPYRRDDDYLKRFEREAKAIARLEHPHVVRLYRYGEVNGLLYMAMQYVQGTDLAFLLRSYQADGEMILPADRLRIIREICQALDYIHAQGIIHRDVKPSNIMLDQNGHVYLTDFGLALLTEMGTLGEAFGSPHYISPEQAISSAMAVAQSDLYAVGVILYEMFTGRLPFMAPEPLDVALMHRTMQPPLPRELRPELSPEIEKVILKALNKQPEDRYLSGRSLVLAMEQAMRGMEEEPRSRRTIQERVPAGQPGHSPLPTIHVHPQGSKKSAGADQKIADQKVADQKVADQQATPAQIDRKNRSIPEPEVYLFGPPPAAPAASEPSSPSTNHRRSHWFKIGAAILASGLVVLMCTASIAALVINRIAAAGQRAPTEDGIGIVGSEKATPTGQSRAPRAPASTPGPESYSLVVGRCPEDGCIVLKNQGRSAISMADLSLVGKKSGIQGAEWGIDLLGPGTCVKAVKDEQWFSELPAGMVCSKVTGHPLVKEGDERFWVENVTLLYEGNRAGECKKGNSTCLIKVTTAE